jgi:DNA-binding response OmpR family regulator
MEQMDDGGNREGIKVLIVEDDDSMGIALRDGFEYEGFDVTLARDGEVGMDKATSASPDLIILDVMLPKKSGLDICKQIRSDGNNVPIIMLTARGQEIDKVLGLKLGADDYVTKPFSFLELMARVEALLRRSAPRESKLDHAEFGDISADFKKCEVTKSGKLLELTPRELELLRFMIEHEGDVVSRDQLLDAVWGYEKMPFTRTVDMHIAKLRKKIEDNPAEPKFLVTVHRYGYKFKR